MEKKVTYEIENGKKVKVKTYDDGSVYKYDEKDNEIYYKDNDSEVWKDYDANGNIIHWKRGDDDGDETWSEYDENGNLIHWKRNDDYELWYEYDSQGNIIHNKSNCGFEWFAKDYEERKSC